MLFRSDKVAAYIKPEDFIDPLFSGVAEKVYEQYGTGNISPAAIIADYATTEEHTEVAAMFSADLDESLNNLEREKTLNDIVIRIKANSLNHELNKTVDPKLLPTLHNRRCEASSRRRAVPPRSGKPDKSENTSDAL